MSKTPKTNAARLLETAGIPFRLVPYKFDENDLAAQHGERTGYFVCVIPGNCEVDLKKAASAAGDKKAEMLPMKELLATTGYIRGGCSPVGMKKPFPTFFHESALDFERIYVSAGVRGLQLEVAPDKLINYVGATVCNIVK